MKSCTICRRVDTIFSMKKCNGYNICSGCKNQYYQFFDRLYKKALSLTNLDKLVTKNDLEKPGNAIVNFVWTDEMNNTETCTTGTSCEDFSKLCQIKWDQMQLKCTACRIRRCCLRFSPPETKPTKKNDLTKLNFRILFKAWGDIMDFVRTKCKNIPLEYMSSDQEVKIGRKRLSSKISDAVTGVNNRVIQTTEKVPKLESPEKEVSPRFLPLSFPRETAVSTPVQGIQNQNCIKPLEDIFMKVHNTPEYKPLIRNPANVNAPTFTFFKHGESEVKSESKVVPKNLPSPPGMNIGPGSVNSLKVKLRKDYVESIEKKVGDFTGSYHKIIETYYNQHRKLYISILVALLKNTSKHIQDQQVTDLTSNSQHSNSQPSNNQPSDDQTDFHTKISDKIYQKFYIIIPYVQTISSYKDGMLYFPVYGAYKMNSVQFLALLTSFYGVEKGERIYHLRYQVTMAMKEYTEYQLVLCIIKSIVNFTISGKLGFWDELNGDEQALIKLLSTHLKQMVATAGLRSDMDNFLKLMEEDFDRVNNVSYTFTSTNCVEIRPIER